MTTTKNLASKKVQQLFKELAEGLKPTEGQRAVANIYEHPIKKRAIIKSNSQIKSFRR